MSPSPPAKPQLHRVVVLVAGEVINAPAIRFDPESFQEQLALAKATYGSAVCKCQSKHLQLVIRERNNKFFLACWPDQAQAHALDCPFYSAATESAASGYSTGAITQDGPSTTLLLHHPLVQQKPVHNARVQHVKRSANGHERLHIWGLLHHLWESGGLNRWHPGWHRDWGLVRSMLRRAAQGTIADASPLLLSLYVPPIWTAKHKLDINAAWEDFVRPLHLHHRGMNPVASAFVIGVVRKIEATQFGYAVRLQHHPTVFYMDKSTSDRLASYSRRGWAATLMMDEKKDRRDNPTIVFAMRVQASSTNTLVIVEGALMRVSHKYIPVASSYEERVANLLVEQDRRFLKPLHYDLHNADLPHFVLTDCAQVNSPVASPTRTAMYIYGATIDPNHQRRLAKSDQELATRKGYGFWQWNAAADKDVPALPPPQQPG